MGAVGLIGVIALEHAAVMVVDGHGHGALGVLLAHHVQGQGIVDLVRRGHARDELGGRLAHGGRGRVLVLVGLLIGTLVLGGICGAERAHHLVLGKGLLQDLVARLDALIADEHAVMTPYELANLILRLTAERAADRTLAVRTGRVAKVLPRH